MTGPTRANRELRRAIERRGCVISEYPPKVSRWVPWDFCSATASSRPSPGRWWWWRPRKRAAPCPPWATQSGTVSRCSPCRAAFFRRLGGDECPSAGRTRKSGLYSGGFIWYTGAADRKTGPGTPGDAPALSENERLVLSCLGAKAQGVEELGVKSGLPTAALLGVLMKLELAGRVSCLPGKRYILRGGSAS